MKASVRPNFHVQ